MTKDYAKKQAFETSSKNQAPRPGVTTAMPSWIWMLFGLLVGGCVSGFFFWKLVYSQKVESQTIAESKQISVPDNSKITKTSLSTLKKVEELSYAKPETNTESEEEPRFDFYTLLPNLTVEVPDVATPKQVEEQKEEVVTTEAVKPEAYILQVASFREETQAEELKVRLILQGQEAKIQTVKINPNDIWYRVYVGPYSLKADALETQQKLITPEGADSLILKIRV